MASLYLLVPLGVLVVVAAIWVFAWAVNDGQLDDLDQQGRRMPDDEP